MKNLLKLIAGLALATGAMASPVPESLRAEFAPSGVLRAGTNLGNPVIAQPGVAGGEPRGVGPSLARELAKRLGVPVTFVTYDTAGKMADGVKQGAWDVAFLAVDPARAEDIAFSAPYVQIEGTYLVPATSSLTKVDQFDREGLTIAVATKSAYDLYLSRHITKAQLVRFPTSQAAIDAFLEGKTDTVGGVRQPLQATAASRPRLRVIEDSFMTIGQASGVPKARTAAAAYLRSFIEEMKASGFVERALKESGINDAAVAPAAR